MLVINVLPASFGFLVFISLLYFAVISMKEAEFRAAGRAFLLSLLLPLPYLFVGLFTFPYQPITALILISLTALTAIIILFPYAQGRIAEEDNTPRSRIDERDIMFSRRLLIEGSDRFSEYYRNNPDKKVLDDLFRSKPGLLEKGSLYYDPFSFSAAGASFTAVEAFHPLLERDSMKEKPIQADPLRISNFIKQWAKKLGSVSAGITYLKDYHLYTHIGRGKRYGQPVDLKHEFAIAVTVEMNKSMIDAAPHGSTVMESAQQYLDSGAIAVQIAEFIHNLGYPARAHIDGNYRVVCPLVARDAGLGEIGRMGLLMTPELGPRVRIAVVTTDLPLIPDKRSRDFSMIEFCRICKKCADVCPNQAIPFDDRMKIEGVNRWQINSEACFTYWCSSGTDCARCVRVCPYSHPDSFLHNCVRTGLRHSPLFRRFALTMDDFFYGKKPIPSDIPKWMNL
jgi:ferredoxin